MSLPGADLSHENGSSRFLIKVSQLKRSTKWGRYSSEEVTHDCARSGTDDGDSALFGQGCD